MGAGATRPEAGRLNFIDAYDENFKVNLRRVKRDRQRVDDRKAVLQSGDGKRKALEKALLAYSSVQGQEEEPAASVDAAADPEFHERLRQHKLKMLKKMEQESPDLYRSSVASGLASRRATADGILLHGMNKSMPVALRSAGRAQDKQSPEIEEAGTKPMSMYRKGRSPSFYHGGHILEQSGTPTSQHARSMTKATVAINALHALTGEKGAIEKWVPPPAGSVSRRDLHPARNVHNCGVTVGWLLKFFYYCNDMFSSTSFSAMDVVEEIIAPSNLQHGCAFCCLPTVDLCSPSAVVSYAPDRPLRELVYCLKQRFRGSHDAAVWIDMFSLQNPCNSRDYLEALPKLVATVPDVMVVADPGGGWCSQPLCLLTAFHASREPEGPGRLQLLTNCVTAEHARDVGIEIGSMSVSQSLQSSDTVDIEGINEHIASHTPGRGAMETEIREIISTAMARLDHFPPQDLVSPKSLDVASSAVIRAAILRSSGSYDRAQALLEEALAIRIDRLGHDHALVAQVYNSLANVLRAKGEYTRSEPMYRKALLITESASGPFDSSLFSPLFNLAELLHYQGKYEDAEPMFRRCLGLIQEGSLDDGSLVVALKYLAQIRKTKGDYDGAENMLWRAHRLKEREKGATHSETTSLMISLAGLARSRGDHKISANLFKRVVEAKAGQDPESVALANALHHLGCAYKSLEEWDSAELAFRHSLQILKKHRQAGHKDLTAEMENLIVVLREKGEDDEAGVLQLRLDAMAEKTGKQESPEVGDPTADRLWKEAQQQETCGRMGEAEQLYSNLLAHLRSTLGASNLHVADAGFSLAQLLAGRAKFSEAKQLHRSVLSIREAKLGPGHEDILLSLSALAQVMEELGELEEAGATYAQLAAHVQSEGSSKPQWAVPVMIRFATLLLKQRKHGIAEPICLKILEDQKSVLPHDGPAILDSMNRLAEAYIGTCKFALAEELYKNVLEAHRAEFGNDHHFTATSMSRLGSALLAAGKTGNARELYQNALEIAERTLPPVHKDMVMHLRRLAVAKNLESDREGSQQLLDRAVAVEQRLVEQVHEAVSPSLATADSSIRRGLLEDGELQLRKAILTVEEALGSRHKYLLEPLEGLVKVLTSLGRLEDAQSYQRQLTAILQSESGGSQVTAAQSIESAGGEEQVGAFFSALSETGKFRMDRITRVANQLNISRRSIDVSDSGQVAVGDGMLDVAPGESVGNSNPTPVPITRYKQGHDERAPPGNAPVCGSSGEPEEYGEIGGTCQDDVSVQPNLAALKASGSYSQAASLCSPQVHDRQESDGAGSMQLAEAFKQMEGNPLADGEAAQAQKVFADAASTVQEGGGKELQETADALKGMSISVDAQGKNDDAGVIDTRAKEIEAQASCWAAGHERRVLPTPGPQGIDDSAWLAAVRPRSGYSRCSEGGEPWAIRVPSARDTGMGLRPVRPPSACRSRDGSETVPDVHRARDVRRSESGIELPPVKRPSAAFTTDAKAGLRSEPSGGNQGKKLPTSHKPLQKRMTEDADRLRIPRKPGLDTGLFKSTEATRQIPRLKGTAGKPRAHRSLSDTGGSDPRDPADLGKALKPTRIADHIRAVDPVLGANIHPAERIRRKIHRSCDLAQLQPRLLPIGQPRAGAP